MKTEKEIEELTDIIAKGFSEITIEAQSCGVPVAICWDVMNDTKPGSKAYEDFSKSSNN